MDASAAASDEAVPEKTKEELAALSKEERTAYHKARMAAKAKVQPPMAAEDQLSKAEMRAKARAKQEEDRKRKEDAQNKLDADAQALEELKLQGLSEEQAREVLAQLSQSAGGEDGEEDDDDEDSSLLGCVRSWMAEQDGAKMDRESIRDFNLKVRFQGHVDSTPPDHLGAMLQIVATQSFTEQELALAKQPTEVFKKVQPAICKWAVLLSEFYQKCDCLTAASIIVESLLEGIASAATVAIPDSGKDCVLVGFLMAIREEIEPVEDEDLLTACRKLDSSTKVMHGFIEFLEDQGSDEDDDDDDED